MSHYAKQLLLCSLAAHFYIHFSTATLSVACKKEEKQLEARTREDRPRDSATTINRRAMSIVVSEIYEPAFDVIHAAPHRISSPFSCDGKSMESQGPRAT